MNYYELLKVNYNASLQEIKTAYKILALKHHPDKGAADGGERFKAICEAYSVLSDKDKRKRYDIHKKPIHINPVAFSDPIEQEHRKKMTSEYIRKARKFYKFFIKANNEQRLSLVANSPGIITILYEYLTPDELNNFLFCCEPKTLKLALTSETDDGVYSLDFIDYSGSCNLNLPSRAYSQFIDTLFEKFERLDLWEIIHKQNCNFAISINFYNANQPHPLFDLNLYFKELDDIINSLQKNAKKESKQLAIAITNLSQDLNDSILKKKKEKIPLNAILFGPEMSILVETINLGHALINDKLNPDLINEYTYHCKIKVHEHSFAKKIAAVVAASIMLILAVISAIWLDFFLSVILVGSAGLTLWAVLSPVKSDKEKGCFHPAQLNKDVEEISKTAMKFC